MHTCINTFLSVFELSQSLFIPIKESHAHSFLVFGRSARFDGRAQFLLIIEALGCNDCFSLFEGWLHLLTDCRSCCKKKSLKWVSKMRIDIYTSTLPVRKYGNIALHS